MVHLRPVTAFWAQKYFKVLQKALGHSGGNGRGSNTELE